MTAVLARFRRPHLVTEYTDDLRLFRSQLSRVGLVVLLGIFIALPLRLDDGWLSMFNLVGLYAIGVIGLNLLTGYTGQVSLGHAAFFGMGSYVWAYFGGRHNLPLPLWILVAAAMGAAIGGIIGPFALRLRGAYLAIVTLGLVFIAQHIFINWTSLTGGSTGVSGSRAARIGPADFGSLGNFRQQQSYFWLIWAFVALAALLAKNIVRSRPGRAMQAVRDRDFAAAVVGVHLARYKVGAFAIGSAYAAVAGALYGSYIAYTEPEQYNLLLSIRFIAAVIVGGVGTIFGCIPGAFLVFGTQNILGRFSPSLTFVTDQLRMSTDLLAQLLYGVVIVLFLVFEPRGIAGIWFRLKAYFRAWPFRY